MNNTTDKIPLSVVNRLPTYLHFVKYLYDGATVSSTVIAKALGLGEVQVRKDLQMVSGAGRPKIGYVTSELVRHLEEFLQVDKTVNCVIVGVGHLGKALLYNDGFAEYGLKIVGAFDVRQIDLRDGATTLSVDSLADFCKANDVSVGIVTVPEQAAQEVADMLVTGGVSAIWNFAPTTLKVPESVVVKNENLASALAVLAVQAVKH